jgi:hypothetical protein
MDYRQELQQNGYVLIDNTSYADLLDNELLEFKWDDQYRIRENAPTNHLKTVNSILFAIHTDLENTYIAPYTTEYELKSRNLWEGLSQNTDVWHHDSIDLKTGNVFFLLYFNDMIDEGALWIKNATEERRIVPKKGTLVMLNNDPSDVWKHRAETANNKRITAKFGFFVKWKT